LDEVEQQLHVYRQESEGWKGKYLELQHSHDASNARQEKGQEKLGQLQDQLSSLQESYRELENVHRDLKYQLALADQKLSQSDARASLALREAELDHQMKQEQGMRQCESLQDLLEQKEKAWMQERQVLEKAESLVRDSLQTCEQRCESEAKVMQSKLETLQSEWRSAMEKANEKTTLHHKEVMHWTARHASLTAELNQTAHQLDQLKQEKEQLDHRVNQLSQGLVEEQRKSETISGQKQSIALELAEWKQSLEQARTWWILHVQSDLCPIPNSSSCPFTIPTTSTAANDSSITNWNNAVVEQLDWAKGQFKSKIVEKDEIIARFMATEAALKDQVLLLEKQELALREQVRSLNDNAKFYESRIVSAQGEAQEWKESSQKAQAQVNTLEQAKARLESDLDHEKANWKDQSAAMEAMELELSRIQEERMEALEKIGHLESELRGQGTIEKIESLCNQVVNLESDLKTKHETIDRLIAEQKDLYQQKSEKEEV
jgi:chromosome segregation ATPase